MRMIAPSTASTMAHQGIRRFVGAWIFAQEDVKSTDSVLVDVVCSAPMQFEGQSSGFAHLADTDPNRPVRQPGIESISTKGIP